MIVSTLVLALCLARAPELPREELSGETLTHLTADGRVKIHYTLSGADALVDTLDVDPQNGVPDTVDWTEEGATRMLAAFVDQDGWALPPADHGRGGDDRLDIYLRAIDANGYAYLETLPQGGFSTYLEVDPAGKTGYTREAFQSIVGHEVHHALEFTAAGGRFSSWLAEATATWAQYLIFDGDEQVRLAQGFLWFWRLLHAARRLDDEGHGDLFEYAGMVWIRFLVERGGGDRKLALELWRAIGETGDWRVGHDAFARAHLPGLSSLDEVAAEFGLWNVFACGAEDGRHYDEDAGCAIDSGVPVTAAPVGATTASVTIGALGSGYLAPPPDCTSAELALRVTATAPMRVHVVAVAAGGESPVSVHDVQAGGTIDVAVPSWNHHARVVVAGTHLGAGEATFSVTPTVSGAYAPPATLPPVKRLEITPGAAVSLVEGARAELRATATYGTCSDGRDVTGEISWHSSDDSVATVSAGTITAIAPGIAEVFSMAGTVESNRLVVTVTADPESGGCAIGKFGEPASPIAFLALALALLLHRRQRR